MSLHLNLSMEMVLLQNVCRRLVVNVSKEKLPISLKCKFIYRKNSTIDLQQILTVQQKYRICVNISLICCHPIRELNSHNILPTQSQFATLQALRSPTTTQASALTIMMRPLI